MPEFFDCLHCGVITLIVRSPPKCVLCGYGTGVIVTKAIDQAVENAGTAPQEQGGEGTVAPERPAGTPPASTR